MLVNIALDDASALGILSSKVHVTWSLAAGGTLEDRPRYNKTRCFETFPFPDPDAATRERIRDLGERLDAHRKRQQELHPDLTLTGIYNVLEKLRSGEPLTPKERKIHDVGLVSVLKQIHDDLDEAVFHAYGWDDLWAKRPGNTGNPVAERATVPTAEPASPLVGSVAASATPDAASEANAESVTTFATLDQDAWENELLERLVALNHERAAEEKAGRIRWLRPDFQNPDGDANDATSTQSELALPAAKKKAATKGKKLTWPDRLPDQVTAIRTLLPETGPDPEALSTAFGRQSVKREAQITEVLEVLASLGQV